jgi:hypothetical protein
VPRVALAVSLAIAATVLLDLPAAAAAAVGGLVYTAVVIALGAVPQELVAELRGVRRTRA